VDHRKYYEYLKQRNRMSLLYRRFFLYPMICRFLSGSVLDYGCGIGDFLKFRPHTVGVDINPYAVEWCRNSGLNAIRIKNLPLPFSSGDFKGAVIDNVIEHIIDPVPVLEEIRRVVIKGGILVVGVPGLKGYLHDSDHKRFYDEQILVDLLNRSGFKCIKIIHVPFKSSCLNKIISQYCIYGIFQNKNT